MEGKSVSCKKCGEKFTIHLEETAPSGPPEQTDPAPEKPGSLFSMDAQLAFGKLAMRSEIITKKQLIEAYIFQKEQRDDGRDIHVGEILLEKEIISQEQLESLLTALSFGEIRTQGRRFGEIAVQMGFAGQSDVDAAIEVQKSLFDATHSVTRLGDILVGDGIITDAQRETIMAAQNRLDTPSPAKPEEPEEPAAAEPQKSSRAVPFGFDGFRRQAWSFCVCRGWRRFGNYFGGD